MNPKRRRPPVHGGRQSGAIGYDEPTTKHLPRKAPPLAPTPRHAAIPRTSAAPGASSVTGHMQTDNVVKAAAALAFGAALGDITTDPASGRGVFTLASVPAGLEKNFREGLLRVEPQAFACLTRDLFAKIRARARAGRRGAR